MLPKGLFGICSCSSIKINDTIDFISKSLSSEEKYLYQISKDSHCILGTIASNIVSYPAIVTSGDSIDSVGVIDGLLYSQSRLSTKPHLLIEEQVVLPSEANGMFICAAYSNNKIRLLSDPFGSFPLYYRLIDDLFLFSSSLKLIQDFPGIPQPKYSEDGIAQFLCFQTVLDGQTIFENIHKL